jgi:hypothetical protein
MGRNSEAVEAWRTAISDIRVNDRVVSDGAGCLQELSQGGVRHTAYADGGWAGHEVVNSQYSGNFFTWSETTFTVPTVNGTTGYMWNKACFEDDTGCSAADCPDFDRSDNCRYPGISYWTGVTGPGNNDGLLQSGLDIVASSTPMVVAWYEDVSINDGQTPVYEPFDTFRVSQGDQVEIYNMNDGFNLSGQPCAYFQMEDESTGQSISYAPCGIGPIPGESMVEYQTEPFADTYNIFIPRFTTFKAGYNEFGNGTDTWSLRGSTYNNRYTMTTKASTGKCNVPSDTTTLVTSTAVGSDSAFDTEWNMGSSWDVTCNTISY